MCLIIHKPANVAIPTEIIESALKYNPDGFGIACNGMRERYTFASEQKARKRLARPDELLVHFRWATAGLTNKGNVHPFALSDGSLLMHNGILPKRYQPRLGLKASENDTRIFIRTYLEPAIARGAWRSVEDIEKEIVGDKLAVMTADASVRLYNAEDWVTWQGLRLSNTYAWDAPDELVPEWERWQKSRTYTFGTKWPSERASSWYREPSDMREAQAMLDGVAYVGKDGSVHESARDAAASDTDARHSDEYAATVDTALEMLQHVCDAIVEREDDVDWRSALFAVDMCDAHLIDGIIDAELTVYDFVRQATAESLLLVYRDLTEKRCIG